MAPTPLGIFAQTAPLADVFTAQKPVTLLHKRAECAVASGHDVVCLVERISPAHSDLALFHQAFYGFGCRCHAFYLWR
jgi:hypothetical protein